MVAVSVLMSVYNGECFLREALSSVLGQTFTDFEFIVVDDASTDRSTAILAEVTDPRLRVLRQHRNAGLVEALNLAASQASGALLARMDADDVAEPERLALQVSRFQEQPGLVLLGTAFDLMDARGTALGRQTVKTGDAQLRDALLQGNQFGHPTAMIRASAFTAAGGYRALGGRFAQDYDLWLRLADLGEIDNLTQSLLRYRVHSAQISVSKLRTQAEAAALYGALARQRRSIGVEDLPAAWREVRAQRAQIRNACVAQLLQQADQLSRNGNEAGARALHRQAALTGPFTPAFRGRMCRWVIGKVHSLAGR